MNRREFGKMSAGATALMSTWLRASARAAIGASKLLRFSFMLWALEKQAPFDQCVEWAAEAGYQGVELVGEF